MHWCELVVLSAITSTACSLRNLTFPDGFKFGVSTASYQIEGGWNASDKSESVWDRFSHTKPEAIANGSNGDVACDSYHQWKRDVEMVSELGVHFYRFSLSWPRILPTGYSNYISEDGKNYYNNLIDALIASGVEPIVTMFHYELPQSIQDLGGWANPLISDWFTDYARVVYNLFGDRVKTWLTVNEPIVYCDAYYPVLTGPNIMDNDVGMYLCNKYMLIAHAKAWRLYDKEFRPKFNGKISYTNLYFWFEPVNAEDQELAELAREFWEGRYGHPVFSKEGGWPPAIEKIVARSSLKLGYPSSRLPPFTHEERELVRGTYDFYALNHYSTFMVRKAKPGEFVPPWPFSGIPELGGIIQTDPEKEMGGASWFMVYPEGLRKQLTWIKQHYGDIEIKIMENGYVSVGDELEDYKRMEYIRNNLEQILLSIRQDAVNVTAYSVWSLMDVFEWLGGYTMKFGLYRVDFNDERRTRTPRFSARYYADIIKNHALL